MKINLLKKKKKYFLKKRIFEYFIFFKYKKNNELLKIKVCTFSSKIISLFKYPVRDRIYDKKDLIKNFRIY